MSSERALKFRAWDEDRKTWTEDFLIRDGGIVEECSDGLMISKLKHLSQFTGLLDKNGKEIYEGDVIQNKNGEFNLVTWEDRSPCYFARLMGKEAGRLVGYPLWSSTALECEIVGNIYQGRG